MGARAALGCFPQEHREGGCVEKKEKEGNYSPRTREQQEAAAERDRRLCLAPGPPMGLLLNSAQSAEDPAASPGATGVPWDWHVRPPWLPLLHQLYPPGGTSTRAGSRAPWQHQGAGQPLGGAAVGAQGSLQQMPQGIGGVVGGGAATWPPDAHPGQPAGISLSPAWLALTGHRHGSQASLDSHPLPSSSQLVCPWAHRTPVSHL